MSKIGMSGHAWGQGAALSQCSGMTPERNTFFVPYRPLIRHLPRRLRARVLRPEEMRMGSPKYGRLILDGDVIAGVQAVEAGSLLWAADGRWLAAQELVSWFDAPTTRVVVIDTARRTRIAESPSRTGLANPIRFERDALVYRHWHDPSSDREMLLTVPSE